MFHVCIKSIVQCLERHPEVRVQDITVACFGGALQMHLPHCMTLLGPNMSWEMWRENGKFAPLFQEHLSYKVQQSVGTRTEYLLSVKARDGFVCLVDIDINTPEHAFHLNGETGGASSVDTENHFYASFTGSYASICRLAASMPNVLVVSMPFRAPWRTDDYEANKQRAVWTQADESMLHPDVDTFTQYNTRPRSSELRALCCRSGCARARGRLEADGRRHGGIQRAAVVPRPRQAGRDDARVRGVRSAAAGPLRERVEPARGVARSLRAEQRSVCRREQGTRGARGTRGTRRRSRRGGQERALLRRALTRPEFYEIGTIHI
jgi:hypothetical protein